MSIRWAEVWADVRWVASVGAVLLTLAAAGGCNKGGGPVGPSDTPVATEAPAVAPLAVPDRLRLVWGTIDNSGWPVARFGANAVALQIGAWGEDVTPFARWARERDIVVFPFVEQVFWQSRGAWEGMWASRVEPWAKPLADAGVLAGWHVTDEWAYRGQAQDVRDEAIAFVRARTGLEVLNTEWVDSVLHRDYRRPQGRFFGVNCYAYASRTPWHTRGCVETFERHPEWNLVVVPAFAGGNMAGPYDQAAWESMADRTGKSIAFWSWEQ